MKSRVYKGELIPHDPRWDVFENFLADMGERPPGKTLDREDPNGIYEKSNCRWASRVVQTSNRRNTRWLTINGETKTLAAWAQEAGISYGALNARTLSGWPAERLLDPMKGRAAAAARPITPPPPPRNVAQSIVAAFAADLPPDRQRRLVTAIRQAIMRATSEPEP